MKRAFLSAVVLLALAASSARGAELAPATLKFMSASFNKASEASEYRGRIASPRTGCEKNRRVIVFADGNGTPDDRIGSALAEQDKDGRYVWLVTDSGFPMAGDYFARVSATNRCKAARSSTYPWN